MQGGKEFGPGKLDHPRAGVGRSVVDQERVAGLDDPGREDDVGNKPVAFEIGFRLENRLRSTAQDARRVFEVEEYSLPFRVLINKAVLGMAWITGLAGACQPGM